MRNTCDGGSQVPHTVFTNQHSHPGTRSYSQHHTTIMTTLHRTPSQLAMSFSLLSSDHLSDSNNGLTSVNHTSSCSIPSSFSPSTPSTQTRARHSISSPVTHTHIFI